MVYFSEWNEFFEKSKELLVQNPAKTRYQLKYRNQDNTVVVKITDDILCLKYKTSEAAALQAMQELNLLYLKVASNSKHFGQVNAAAGPGGAKDKKDKKKKGKKGGK